MIVRSDLSGFFTEPQISKYTKGKWYIKTKRIFRTWKEITSEELLKKLKVYEYQANRISTEMG